ncbi:MAG TPA: hypothetical protein VF644_08780 [Pyrinomonadaceae bacterium]|jgi:hydroxylamine reductase (hybrid-cluster protein)
MTINFAHVRERSTNGGWIDFAVFKADANNRTNSARADVLQQLTMKARRKGLKVDQSALVFSEHGQTKFYGSPNLVQYLSNNGVPRWTHSMDI